MNQAEIVIYRASENTDFQIEVRVEDETVWLTQAQMAELFQTTRNNITLHVGNIFKESELAQKEVSKESLLTAADGKRYKTNLYNLDVIISVGYRVKSLRGTQFRIWATKILKEFLLNGHVINHRLTNVEKEVHNIHHKISQIEIQINANMKPREGIFYDGQIFDAWEFVSGIIKEAGESIILIDNYVDESVLSLLTKRKSGVNATIYTANLSRQLKHDLAKHNKQYPSIDLITFTKAHDRFLIIDRKTVYHIGASLKDLGKKWFAFSRIALDAEEMIRKCEN
jgi:hypothetical protein